MNVKAINHAARAARVARVARVAGAAGEVACSLRVVDYAAH
jgi:hypothetical protein